jgi:hypothetical protein
MSVRLRRPFPACVVRSLMVYADLGKCSATAGQNEITKIRTFISAAQGVSAKLSVLFTWPDDDDQTIPRRSESPTVVNVEQAVGGVRGSLVMALALSRFPGRQWQLFTDTVPGRKHQLKGMYNIRAADNSHYRWD